MRVADDGSRPAVRLEKWAYNWATSRASTSPTDDVLRRAHAQAIEVTQPRPQLLPAQVFPLRRLIQDRPGRINKSEPSPTAASFTAPPTAQASDRHSRRQTAPGQHGRTAPHQLYRTMSPTSPIEPAAGRRRNTIASATSMRSTAIPAARRRSAAPFASHRCHVVADLVT